MSTNNSRPVVLFFILLFGGAILTLIVLKAPHANTKDKPNDSGAVGASTTNVGSIRGQPALKTTPVMPSRQNNGSINVADNSKPATSTNSASEGNSDSSNGNAVSNLMNKLTSEYLRNNVQQINFYGLVLDQENQPVENAEVRFSKTYGGENVVTKSDNSGRFGLSNVSGRYLTVDVSRSGYFGTTTSRQTFDYSPVAGDFHPDISNPIVFKLRKGGAGVDLITSQNGASPNLVVKPPTDGTITSVDLMNRRVGDHGQLQIEKMTPPYDPKDYSNKEWSLTLSIPNGGFVAQDDEFPFEAPTSGYAPKIEFHFRPTDRNWTDSIEGQYYIAFGNPRVYGHIKLASGVYRGVTLEYAINPTGSRNLEPKQER